MMVLTGPYISESSESIALATRYISIVKWKTVDISVSYIDV